MWIYYGDFYESFNVSCGKPLTVLSAKILDLYSVIAIIKRPSLFSNISTLPVGNFII